MQINDENTQTIETIKTYALDIESAETKLKAMKEQAQEILEDMNEYKEVEELGEQMKAARQKLKTALLGEANYNDLLEEIGQTHEMLKDQKGILSDYLVAYFGQTGERQVEISDQEAREVILKGKLGKEQKYQLPMFKKTSEREFEYQGKVK